MTDILLTYEISPILMKILQKKDFSVNKIISKYPLKESELIKYIKDKDGILSNLTDRLSKKVLSNANKLKVISQCSAGLDNIDLEYAKQKNIIVYNTPTVLSVAVAELTVAMILNSLRNIIPAHIYTKQRKFTGWKVDLFLGELLNGKTVGIIGMGNIGREVAKRLHYMGANILYTARTQKKDIEELLNAKYCNLTELLSRSDIVTIHIPLSKQTHNLLDAKKLSCMKKDALLINTSRGEILDEIALIKLLKNNHIKMAALDVYRNEPYLNKNFYNLENVLLLPHIGSAVTNIRFSMMEQAVNNIIKFFNK